MGEIAEIVYGNRVIRYTNNGNNHFWRYGLESMFDKWFSAIIAENVDGLEILDFTKPAIHEYRDIGCFRLFFPEDSPIDNDYMRYVKSGHLAFDIGACCGVSTVWMARHFERVVGFEPDPENYSYIKDNTKLENIQISNLAICGESGTVKFNAEGWIGSAVTSCIKRSSFTETIEVKADTLDNAFCMFGIPDFIKMDSEGAEIPTLLACTALLKKHKPHFAIDTCHFVDGELTKDRVEHILTDCGYTVQSDDDNGYWTTRTIP